MNVMPANNCPRARPGFSGADLAQLGSTRRHCSLLVFGKRLVEDENEFEMAKAQES